MPKRRKRRRPRRPAPRSSSSVYQQAVRQADELLAKNRIEIRPDNWQELVLDWVTPDEPELSVGGTHNFCTPLYEVGAATQRP